MVETGAFPFAHITFPQGPIIDPATNNVTLEWFMFFQSLQALLIQFVDVESIRDLFVTSDVAGVSSVQKQIDGIIKMFAMIKNPDAAIAKISNRLDALATLLAMQTQFNPGTLQKRIDAIETMGIFV